MAMTNVEKQRAFRARQKAKGFKRAYAAEFYAGTTEQGTFPALAQREFAAEMKNLLKVCDDDIAANVYAELLAYAKQVVVPKFKKVQDMAAVSIHALEMSAT